MSHKARLFWPLAFLLVLTDCATKEYAVEQLRTPHAPREVLTGWLHTVANLNPVTYLLEAARAAEFSALGWSELWPGLAALAGLLAVLGTWAVTGLATLGRR